MIEIHNPFELEPSWKEALKEELQKSYLLQLASFLQQERLKNEPIYPPEKLYFNAFTKTPYSQVKVVIVGQDPYHQKDQAHGLSFSVPKDINIPRSLINIYKELQEDLNIPPASHGCLLKWAEQGVLLLNATLTVKDSSPLSHHNRGWEVFTDAVIEKIAEKETPLVFILWGNSAQKKCERILKDKKPNQLILKAPHPSPLSAHQGFFGSRPFSQTNAFLENMGSLPIDWKLE